MIIVFCSILLYYLFSDGIFVKSIKNIRLLVYLKICLMLVFLWKRKLGKDLKFKCFMLELFDIVKLREWWKLYVEF